MPPLKEQWEKFRDATCPPAVLLDPPAISLFEGMYLAGAAATLDTIAGLLDEGLTPEQAILWIGVQIRAQAGLKPV